MAERGAVEPARVPAERGDEWTAEGFNKWRERVFLPAIRSVGLDHARPYDVRHSFASLLLHEGRSVIYEARRLGHGADLTLSTYGHTIDELDEAPRISADEAIRLARDAVSTTRHRNGLARDASRQPPHHCP